MGVLLHIIAIWLALQLPIGITVGTYLAGPRNPSERGREPNDPAPPHHQPLHHGSDSHGSVGSLGSIHDTEVRHS